MLLDDFTLGHTFYGFYVEFPSVVFSFIFFILSLSHESQMRERITFLALPKYSLFVFFCSSLEDVLEFPMLLLYFVLQDKL
jgi:hypothetical protein